MTPGRKNIPILEVNIICYVGVKLKFAKQQHFDMFGHYCYGIQGPTVLYYLYTIKICTTFKMTQRLQLLTMQRCKYYTEQSLDILAPTLTPITFMSTSANKIFASSADSSGS